MRERIVAIAACSIIFLAVVVIAAITIANSRQLQKAAPGSVNTAPAITEQTAPPPPPPPKRRFKRPDAEDFRADFDYTQVKQLTGSLANYQFKAGILVDLTNRKVLWEKNSSAAVPIASLTKLLTIYTAFEELEHREEIGLDSLVTVSHECSTVNPVRAGLKPGDKIPLHDVFVCAMLKSANDAAHLIAEYFGYGDSSCFIDLMNQKAGEIGMASSKFFNANGLPIYSQNPNDTKMNMASCQDMVKLIDRIYDYPMIIRYTRAAQANTKVGNMNNGNRLLGVVPGMEGLKTGYTKAAGHCLAFSCSRNGRRLVGVVTGFTKRQNCFTFVSRLLEWGYKLNP